MAKRWASKALVGFGVASLLSSEAFAQGMGSPASEPLPAIRTADVPVGGQSGPWPQFGGGPVQVSYDVPTPPGSFLPGNGNNFVGPQGSGYPPVGLPHGMAYCPGEGQPCRTFLGEFFHKIFYDDCEQKRPLYFTFGYLGLTRNSLQRRPLVAYETEIPDPLIPDSSPFPTPFGQRPTLLDGQDLTPNLHSGVKFGLGFQTEDGLWEAVGWFLGRHGKTRQFEDFDRLDAYYDIASVGFQDNNGLWTNADRMVLSYKQSIWSGEINYRWFTTYKCYDINYLLGVRYVKHSERFIHGTQDDAINVTDPVTWATLDLRGENDMVGGQLGFSINQKLSPVWSLSWDAKCAFLANGAQTAQSLTRGDGLVGFDVAHTSWRLATLVETGLFLNFGNGSWRMRGGYEMKFFSGIATAENQFSYDLEAIQTIRRTAGNAFYHGPSFTVDLVY